MRLLTRIFKALIPDWPIIFKPSEMSLDAREIEPPKRVIEERGSGTFIKKEHEEHILDHQAELSREIMLGIGLWDCNRTVDMSFTVPVLQAQSIQEHEEHMMAHIVENLQDYSPERACPLSATVPQEYHMVAKTFNDAIELWCFLPG
jgi:hypothetical protein